MMKKITGDRKREIGTQRPALSGRHSAVSQKLTAESSTYLKPETSAILRFRSVALWLALTAFLFAALPALSYSAWVISTVDSTGVTGFYTSVAVDPQNKVHISYHDGTNLDLRYVTNASGPWVTTTIDSTGDVGTFTSLAVDPQGYIHISYYDATNQDLKYATNASGPWVTTTIDSSGDVGKFTSIAVDPQGHVHIAYYDYSITDLKYATNTTGPWVITTIDNSCDVGAHTSLALDSQDKVHISYFDACNYDLKYATNVTSGWVTSTVDNAGDVGIYSSIALDPQDKAHISYYDTTNQDLKYAINTTGQWATSTIDSTGDMGAFPSLAFDSQGYVHISYFDWTSLDLRYATNATGVWTTSTIDSAGMVGVYTSIAVDSQDYLHISYQDNTNLDLKYATTALSSAASSINLPQTRQTACYDSSGVVINCAVTGQDQDGEVQAGVAWPSLRFTNSSGPLTPLISGGIVQDNLTGLQWTQDAGTPTVPGCSTGVPGCSQANECTGGQKNWQAALDYVACLNSIPHLTYNDWRLPNINELTFVNAGQANMAGWMTTQGFQGLTNGQNYYWSSTTSASTPTYAWNMDFDSGIVDYDSKSLTNYYVWPVRAGQSGVADPAYPANIGQTGQFTQITSYDANNPQSDDGALQMGILWPSPRFTDNLDDTITDNLTGLIWAENAATPTLPVSGPPVCIGGPMSSWQQALNYVQCLNNLPGGYLTYNDWRLPNINELHSLVDHLNYGPALPSQNLFAGVQQEHYWSSTANAGTGNNMSNPDDAWSVDFVGGGVYNNNPASRQPYVLPVRGGSGGALCVPINAGLNVQVMPVTGLYLNFTNVTQSGNLCAWAITPFTPLQLPSNFQVLPGAGNGIAYYINFSGQFVSAQVCIHLPISSTSGVMWHNTGSWNQLNPTTPGLVSQIPPVSSFCAMTNTFSEFAVMEPVGTTPEPFTFTPQTGVALNTLITSNTIAVSGINAPSPISITGGTYSINGGAYTSGGVTVNNGDTVTVRVMSSGINLSPRTATLTIGGVSGSFSVTTMAANTPPVPSMTITKSGWTVTVTDNSTDAEDAQSALGVTVDWGSGSPSTGAGGSALTKTYTAAGNYVIKHKVKDSAGVASWSANTSVSVPVKYTVSGKITRSNGTTAIAGVILYLKSATKTYAASSKTDGTYTFSNVPAGTYNVIAIKAGYTFSNPAFSGVVVTSANVTGLNISSLTP
jgi:hypothetical protein